MIRLKRISDLCCLAVLFSTPELEGNGAVTKEDIIRQGKLDYLHTTNNMDLSWILGRARVAFHHSKNPVSLATKSGKKTTLDAICKDVTPPCNLNPLLFNGHLQTFWTAVKAEGPKIIYKRKIVESTDARFAGTFTLDFVVHSPASETDSTLPPRTTYFSDAEYADLDQGSDDTKPMLITLHGLSGGSHEIYLRQVLAPLVEQHDAAGWEAVVVNSRGCANSSITTGILYNARATWDLRQTVKWCREKFPNRPLFAIGYSLGANILTNVRMAHVEVLTQNTNERLSDSMVFGVL